MSDWSEDTTLCFLEAYQNEPCIWNSKDINHKNRKKVHDAWTRISVIMNKNVKELKNKKEILMATFRRHFKKKQDSIRSGAGADDIYRPIWFAYDLMESFLGPVYTSTNNINTEDAESSSTLDHPENSQCYKDLPTPPKKIAFHKVDSEEQYQLECASHKNNRLYCHESDQYINDFSIPSKKGSIHPSKTNCEEPNQLLKRDEYFYWAMACAADIRNMERTQQVYAKKAIAEILMEGQLGTLSRDSVKVNHHLNNPILVKVGSQPASMYENNPLLLQNEQE